MIGVAAISHVLPSLEIIRELVARGHRVTYANDPTLADVITPTGATFVPFDSRLPSASGDEWPEEPIEAMTRFLDDGMRVLPQLRAVYDADPADLYLYDIGAYAARVLAESQGRPLMQLSPTFVAWKGYEQEVGAGIRALPGADAYWAKFETWLAGAGATTLDVDTFTGPPGRSLAMIPRAMQPRADEVNTDVVTFVGPCFEGREQGGWTRPEDAERVLLVSLGSAFTRQPEFYRNCVAAFGDIPGLHIVLQIGKEVAPSELGPLPANVDVRSWVPQMAILEEADVFVTHAGMGSSSEALRTGTPMIAVPQAVDQFANADQLVGLGVARRIDTADATPEALRAAYVELTTDADVARSVERLRAQALAEGGTERAADLIEAMLR
ncbi:glycosyl transferase [Streptomyces tsukubensis]|nr:glycosyl transferase [Streptomyces tsukubensis]